MIEFIHDELILPIPTTTREYTETLQWLRDNNYHAAIPFYKQTFLTVQYNSPKKEWILEYLNQMDEESK